MNFRRLVRLALRAEFFFERLERCELPFFARFDGVFMTDV